MNDDEVRALIALALSKSIKVIMKNHFYSIGGQIYRQKDGGCIGMDLTVELASIYMSLWDQHFLSLCKKLGLKIDLYKRYVDDILVILDSLSIGWKFDKRKKTMVYNPEISSTEQEPDSFTMNVLLDIANTLDQNIQLTGDCPSKNQSKRLPVLDLEIWVENDKVEFSFYQKPMSSPYVNLFRSALPIKTKRNSLFQEGIRRLQNISPGVSVEEKNKILAKFMNSLRISGYDKKYRFELLKGVIEKHQQNENEILAGNRVRYRTGAQILAQKQQKTGQFTDTWFLNDKVSCILKVQATPESLLADKVKKKIGSQIGPDGGVTKIVEMGGSSILSGMGKSDPFRKGGCQFEEKCPISENQSCTDARVVYQFDCKQCAENLDDQTKLPVYIGTTGHSAHKRAMEHMTAVRGGVTSNPLVKHSILAHGGDPPQFNFKTLKTGFRFNTERMIFESLSIEEAQGNSGKMLLNGKSEWGQKSSISRLRIDR